MNDEQTGSLEALREENAALRRAVLLLHRIANLSRESLEPEPVLYAILTGVTAGVGLGLNRAMVFLVDPRNPSALRGAAAVGPVDREEADRVWKSIEAESPDLQTLYEAGLRRREDPGPLDRAVRQIDIALDSTSPVAHAWRQQRLVRAEAAETDEVADPRTGLASPMRGRAGVHGVLYGDNRFTGQIVDDVTAMVFSLVADHAGRALENARSYAHVALAARTDALTGLPHHGALMQAVAAAVVDAERTGESLSVAMLDLDDFKAVNDRRGHLVGDRVLAAVSARLRSVARAGSTYRYGGEEFTVLLRGAEEEAASGAAERLCAAVASAPIDVQDGEPVRVTCSIGVATFTRGTSAMALLEAADRALLSAKSAGKNRVVVSPV